MKLKRHSMWVSAANLKALERIGKKLGGLSPSALTRLAVQEFIQRQTVKG